MRVAFYAPLKPPDHAVPSGDRRVARLLIAALAEAGHDVDVASDLRSYDGRGDEAHQRAVFELAENEARRLMESYARGRPRPDIWFTYHPYYKAPDWIGPRLAGQLAIPYVTAEASFAAKRAGGAWACNHAGLVAALTAAQLHFCMTAVDRAGLAALLGDETRLLDLPPFLDLARIEAAQRPAESLGLKPGRPVVLAVGMMRPGDKAASYRVLAETMGALLDREWQLLLVGDGPARPEVEAAFAQLPADRVLWTGELRGAGLSACYAAADLYVWPAHNEAYGMALLEAQAHGVPVVAQAFGGVPDVVVDGRTGRLTPPGDRSAFAAAVAALLDDPAARRALGAAARDFVRSERDIAQAARRLDAGLKQVLAMAERA